MRSRNRPKQRAGRVESCADDRRRLCDGGGEAKSTKQREMKQGYALSTFRLCDLTGHVVLKTVCPKGTGVRIPLPAPKNKDTPCGCPLFFATVRGSRTPLCESCARRMGFAYPTRRSKSSLFRRRVWVSSPLVNTPLPSPTFLGVLYFCLE